MAPTPGPPHSWCARRAKARSHFVTGLDSGRESAELGADARALKDGDTFLGSRHGAVAAEERRHIDSEAGIADPASKARDMRADAGHLGHDDHGWS